MLEFPAWLVSGLLIGGAFAVVATGVFAVGTRLYPGPSAGQPSGLSSEDRRRAEIRKYFRAIGESFAEDHFVAGQRVAFYLPQRDVAVTFDAKAYFRIERSGTDAVLVEHELPGAGIGARLPFETPDPVGDSHGADSAGTDSAGTDSVTGKTTGGNAHGPGAREQAVSAAFSTLDVSRDAELSAVESAYREKVKEVHPDQGGDREAFRQVREAYTIARKQTK